MGLRGQAQLMLAALIARNFPRTVLHSLLLSAGKETQRFPATAPCWLKSLAQLNGLTALRRLGLPVAVRRLWAELPVVMANSTAGDSEGENDTCNCRS